MTVQVAVSGVRGWSGMVSSCLLSSWREPLALPLAWRGYYRKTYWRQRTRRHGTTARSRCGAVRICRQRLRQRPGQLTNGAGRRRIYETSAEVVLREIVVVREHVAPGHGHSGVEIIQEHGIGGLRTFHAGQSVGTIGHTSNTWRHVAWSERANSVTAHLSGLVA